MTDPVDNEETPEEEKDDGFDFEDDSPAPMIDDDAVLESEDTYECLSSTEVDHLEKEDQEMEHEKLCTKSVSFNERVRTRIIEDKCAKFIPLVGMQVIAKWEDDNTFYRANIIDHLDDGRFMLDFIHYGPGTSKAEDVYLEVDDTPEGSMIDFYLQQEQEGLRNMRQQVRESRERYREGLRNAEWAENMRRIIRDSRERNGERMENTRIEFEETREDPDVNAGLTATDALIHC